MKYSIIFIALLILCITGCNSSSKSESSIEPQIIYSAEVEPNLPFTMIYPTKEDFTEPWKDKLWINDIYIAGSKGKYGIVIDYKFKNCLDDKPRSFTEMYTDSAYINGIEIKRFPRDINGAEAQINTKVLSMHYANVKTAFLISDDDIKSNKDFTILIYWDRLKTYEFTGKLGDLEIKPKA